jgi:hypothetical protein
VEAPYTGNLAVRADAGVPRGRRGGEQGVEIVNEQRRMRLAGGHERLLDPEVKNGRTGREPAPAARRERRRLEQFGHPEDPSVKRPGRVLAPARHC